MSDLMRKEFEQAVVNMHVSHGVTPEDAAAFLETGSNGYRSFSTKSAWWSWRASRECLVIELPESVKNSGTAYIETIRAFIEKQGIKTK